MIPVRDRNPASRTAVVTLALIAINLAVFFLVEPIGEQDPRAEVSYFACNAAIPYEVTHGRTLAEAVRSGELRDVGSRIQGRIQLEDCPDKNVWLSILASMFLHGGFLHIAGNMLYLWVFGNNVEDRLGRLGFVLLYLASGAAATFAQSFVTPSSTTPLIGASGAVAGVLGAYLLMFPRARVVTLVFFFFIAVIELPAALVLGVWFVLQLFQSVGSIAGEQAGIAYMAHVAGFVAGMLLLAVLPQRRTRPSPPAFL